MKALAVSGLALVLTTGVALADPPAAAPASAPAPSSAPDPAPAAANDPAPGITQALSLVDVPPRPPLSLRIEALRIATERVAGDWPYPEPADIMSYRSGQLFFGAGHYRPRTRRSGALHAGAISSTMLGTILLQSGSPLAGVGALLTGATLDAAAADADRDAEAGRSLP